MERERDETVVLDVAESAAYEAYQRLLGEGSNVVDVMDEIRTSNPELDEEFFVWLETGR